jgi:hypothetical protein
MANRQFAQFRYSLEKMVVDLYAAVAFGSTGAPTLDTKNSKGIKSIARTAAGKYTVTLADKYQRVLAADAALIAATGVPAAPHMFLVADGSASGTVTIQFAAPSGASGALVATDPASGHSARIHFALSNSTAL